MEGDNKQHQKPEMEDRDDNKNFYDQFDRKSPLFHHGDPTPVPYGQQKVPSTMPSEFPEGFDPEQATKPDPHNSDPVVVNLTAAMGAFRDYKKHWSKVADVFVVRGQQLEKKASEGAAPETFVTDKLREEIKVAEDFAKGFSSNAEFKGFEDAHKKLLDFIEKIGTDIKKGKEDSKVEITTFTRQLFKLQNEMMAKIKQRKKDLSKAAPAEGGAKTEPTPAN
jgi:hypothetical protein